MLSSRPPRLLELLFPIVSHPRRLHLQRTSQRLRGPQLKPAERRMAVCKATRLGIKAVAATPVGRVARAAVAAAAAAVAAAAVAVPAVAAPAAAVPAAAVPAAAAPAVAAPAAAAPAVAVPAVAAPAAAVPAA